MVMPLWDRDIPTGGKMVRAAAVPTRDFSGATDIFDRY